MRNDSLGRRDDSKNNTIIWVGACFLILSFVLLFVYSLNGGTEIKNNTDEHINYNSLSCESEEISYPFFTYDNSRKKSIKINIIFTDDKLDTISLVVKLYYASLDSISVSETTNHAEMNKSFSTHGLSVDSFNANYSALDDSMQMSLYADSHQLDSTVAEYFLLEGDPSDYNINGMAKQYNSKGFNCVIKE